MAIYIKGVDNIEVEQTIAVTKLIDGTFLYTEVSDKGRMTIYTKDVYIIPEPHGRLIDADELFEDLKAILPLSFETEKERRLYDQIDTFKLLIEEVPTVIEGSE